MKCYIHPREDALYECHVCGKPICGDCMKFGDDNEITCPKCTLDPDGLVHLEEMEENERLYDEQFSKGPGLSLKQRLAVKVNPIFILILLAIIGLKVYIGYQVDKSQVLVNFSDEKLMERGSPAAQFTYLAAQVFRHHDEHGKWPKNLDKLVGDYIDKEPLILKTNDAYSYTRESQVGFVLSVPNAKRFGFLKLYLSADGDIFIE